ncbi:hypothetical protein [Stenotrophomonas maltophilia]|uniref:hypothetical protein n=1 Tax=Stenotrophomonas maltophilia TaxID=40324 RepID=UPI0039C27F77
MTNLVFVSHKDSAAVTRHFVRELMSFSPTCAGNGIDAATGHIHGRDVDHDLMRTEAACHHRVYSPLDAISHDEPQRAPGQ